jgi:hypothetical protein
MLFAKPIEEITFEDIENFCKEGLEESSRLEYKKDFSSKDPNFQIAKEIAQNDAQIRRQIKQINPP